MGDWLLHVQKLTNEWSIIHVEIRKCPKFTQDDCHDLNNCDQPSKQACSIKNEMRKRKTIASVHSWWLYKLTILRRNLSRIQNQYKFSTIWILPSIQSIRVWYFLQSHLADFAVFLRCCGVRRACAHARVLIIYCHGIGPIHCSGELQTIFVRDAYYGQNRVESGQFSSLLQECFNSEFVCKNTATEWLFI